MFEEYTLLIGPEELERIRKQIAEDTEKFIREGGVVQVIPFGKQVLLPSSKGEKSGKSPKWNFYTSQPIVPKED